MKKIYFATTNRDKINEAQTILDMEVEAAGYEDIKEIQSLDPLEVTKHKAQEYYKRLKKPIVVEDTFIALTALNGLPGPYFKDFYKALGNQGFCDLLNGKKDRSAYAQTTLIFYDSKGKPHTFIGKMKGVITKKPKGKNGWGWDPIFLPNGSKKTLGQMDITQKNKYSMRKNAFVKMRKWIQKELVD